MISVRTTTLKLLVISCYCQAVQFNKSLEKWKSLTSGKEILQLIAGNIIEFETIQLECHYLYNVKFSELETE